MGTRFVNQFGHALMGHYLLELICKDLSALKEYYPYFVRSDFPCSIHRYLMNYGV